MAASAPHGRGLRGAYCQQRLCPCCPAPARQHRRRGAYRRRVLRGRRTRPPHPAGQRGARRIRLRPDLPLRVDGPTCRVRPPQLHLQQTPAPQFLLPRRPADRRPDVPRHRRRRGATQLRAGWVAAGAQHRNSCIRRRGAALLPELAAGGDRAAVRAHRGVPVGGGEFVAAAGVDVHPAGHRQDDDGHAGKPCRLARGPGLRCAGAREAQVRRRHQGPRRVPPRSQPQAGAQLVLHSAHVRRRDGGHTLVRRHGNRERTAHPGRTDAVHLLPGPHSRSRSHVRDDPKQHLPCGVRRTAYL